MSTTSKSILCFGDSNTWGLIAGTKERYPWGIRWTSLLQEKLPFPDYRVIEEGLCGRTTVFEDPCHKGISGEKALPILLNSHKPLSQIVLMLGTNDCKKNYHATVDEICAGVQKLIDQIRRITPDCPVLLVSRLHWVKESGRKAMIRNSKHGLLRKPESFRTPMQLWRAAMGSLSWQPPTTRFPAKWTASTWMRTATGDLPRPSITRYSPVLQNTHRKQHNEYEKQNRPLIPMFH